MLDRLTSNHVNAVAANVVLYQDEADAHAIYRHPEKTVLDNAIRDVVRGCHARGMSVLLKVNMDDGTEDETWRGHFLPADTNAWFASYTNWMVEYRRCYDSSHDIVSSVFVSRFMRCREPRPCGVP